ncbi:VWA domain-containing protein [Streptomyces sp. NPDC012950]|uniref:VWA domain-containing protein n=1 Tax=Streptomyces sp. NPDC012950 TaxID=3364858 RepID=UPI0036C330D8
MGIRNMLRKVFGRDREDSPATSVPPQSRETAETTETTEAVPASEPVTSPEAPEEVRRAADDLVAASFDNPQVPKARSAETVAPAAVEVTAPAETGAPAETVARLEPAEPETSTMEPVEAPESAEPVVEEETPVLSPAAEAAERDAAGVSEAESVEVSLPEERTDETGLSAEVEAVEISYPEPPAEPESEPAVAEAPEAETTVAEAPAEPEAAIEPEAVTQESEPAVAETSTEPEPEPAVAETPAPEPATAAAPAPEPAVAETPAEPETATEPEAVTEPEPEPEPEPVVVAAPAPEASAPQASAPVPTPETPVITALEPEAPEDAEVAAPVAAGPALSLAKVKAAAPHLADAYKAAGTVLKKQGLTGARAAVYLVVDRSGSMRGYFKDGSVQRLAEQTVALAAHLDENAAVTAVFFSTDIDGTAELTPATLSPTGIEEINAGLGRLGRTHYHRAVEEVLAHHEKTDPARPALVVFQTDGAPDAKTAATQALAGAADRPLHWRFVAWGEQDNKAFDYLRKLGGTPRTAAYFPGAAPAGTAHAAFYRGLLEGLEL